MLKAVPPSEIQDCPEHRSSDRPDLKIIPGGLDKPSSQSLLTHEQVSDVLGFAALQISEESMGKVLSTLREGGYPDDQVYSPRMVEKIGVEMGLCRDSIQSVLRGANLM